MELITRAEARARGLKRYFTGKSCKRGHVAERFVSECRCVECDNEKARRYYSENREERLAFNQRYCEANRQSRQQYFATYRAENRAKLRLYYKDNSEQILQRQRVYRSENKERLNELHSLYKKENTHIDRANSSKRRAAKLQRIPIWYGEFDELVMKESADLCRMRKLATGIEWNVDHMIPLQAKKASGLHCAANIQVIPEALNLSKQNKLVLTTPCEWVNLI